jgi:hypothetical protein
LCNLFQPLESLQSAELNTGHGVQMPREGIRVKILALPFRGTALNSTQYDQIDQITGYSSIA